jgi:hypothetical protein
MITADESELGAGGKDAAAFCDAEQRNRQLRCLSIEPVSIKGVAK